VFQAYKALQEVDTKSRTQCLAENLMDLCNVDHVRKTSSTCKDIELITPLGTSYLSEILLRG
jgi:hypothetical protein